MTSVFDRIIAPSDIKTLSQNDLEILAKEIRSEVIEIVSQNGGHLGASLGVVELTIALHYIFDLPTDRLIWDIGHQAYPHKLLTGRRDAMRKLRQAGGPSGFTRRSESPYDPFGAAHAATSISAALGFSVARDLKRLDHHVIAVIGDGSMSAGMAYEGLNNAGAMPNRLLVVLNDNDMSIASPVGAMSAYLSRLLSSHSYRSFREMAKDVVRYFPRSVETAARRMEEYAKGMVTGGTLFEELGFYYIGPIDGHDFDHLLPILKNLRDDRTASPILLHVVTQKGKGYSPAECASDKYHGVNKFDIATGTPVKPIAKAPTYTHVFSQALIYEAQQDERIVAITAAMPAGTGLDAFAQHFPDRCFDVGIAEQHAVTFAAGLACEGLKPFVAIYSTFLQRAYDQVVHDVMLQKLPVRFILDRAGLVGADGATHAGIYDLAYLGCLPDFVIMAPSDEIELVHMITTAAAYNEGPLAIRFPRGEGEGGELPLHGQILSLGRGRIVREGKNTENSVAILSLGTRLGEVLKAEEMLSRLGISVTVADARFMKPLDHDLIMQLARHHESLVTIEDGSTGGFGGLVLQYLCHNNLFEKGLKVRALTLPDHLIDHDTPHQQYEIAHLNARHITRQIGAIFGKEHPEIFNIPPL